MNTPSPAHQALIDQIRASIPVVRRAVETIPPGRLTAVPQPGEWSALETLTHLRDVVVHVYGTRMRRLLSEDAPAFTEFDEETYRAQSLKRGETAAYLLETIVAEHEQLARLLEGVPDADWLREGRHPSMGILSVEFLARRISEHAIEHAAQITVAARER